MLDFGLLPPEVNSGRMYSGPGPGPLLAASEAWDGLAAELGFAASGYGSALAELTSNSWVGPTSVAMMSAITPYIDWLTSTGAQAEETANHARAAVAAYEAAFAMTVPPPVIAANRALLAALVATNFFGQNTPGIVERDCDYFAEHWPHNSSVGWTYSAALTGLIAALAVPPPVGPMGASPAAPAAAAESVGQAAAQAGMHNAVQASTQAAGQAASSSASPAEATGQLSSLMQAPMQMVSGVTAPLKDMLQAPMQAMQGVTSLPQSLMQAVGGMFPTSLAPNAAAAASGGGSVPVLAGGAVSPGGAGGAGSFPGAGLTSYTRPTSSFEAQAGGRPASLRAGVLNAAEVRSPMVSTGGAPVPMAPAGMLARGNDAEREDVARVRVVADGSQP